jgi:hypothetical protein
VASWMWQTQSHLPTARGGRSLSDSESSRSAAERSAPAEPPTATPRPDSPTPSRPGSRRVLTGAAAALGAIAVVAAVTFGILWGTTSSNLRNAQDDLLAVQNELAAEQAVFDDLERDARYTACAKLHAGFAMGTGLEQADAARYALDSCDAESAWESITIDNAPER